MYINEIYIENYGCIEKLAIKPEFDDLGQPKPVVLVGKNGTGKTLLLSNIVDSIIEFKRKKYIQLKEVFEGKYYKLGSKTYIKNTENYSYIRISYSDDQTGSDDQNYSYVDCMVNNYEKFKENEYDESKHKELDVEDSEFKENGFYKRVNPVFKDDFNSNIFLYFPVHRYYEPAWLNQEVRLSFEKEDVFINKSNKNIIKTNVVHEISSWILDVVLDKLLYESVFEKPDNLYLKNYDSQSCSLYEKVEKEFLAGYSGKNSIIHELINEILTIVYKLKSDKVKHARIGISRKENGRQISILVDDGSEVGVAPTLNHLSSGEALLLSLFASLLKEYDSLGNYPSSLDDVKGVVLIDEIDLNLHIDYAKNVLPKLMSLFPNVQFIVTSHSPFFLLGMKEIYKNNYQLINLPNGESVSENDFSEIVAAYNIFTKGFDELRVNLSSIELKVKELTKPLIVTEGKTDWKHFKAALSHFKHFGKYRDIDVVFFEYGDEISMGDSHLATLLTNLSKIKHDRTIIGIFDCDEAYGEKCAKKNFVSFGNNVYAFSISLPNHRIDHSGISVELLYKDDDLLKVDSSSRRLYLTSEFNEFGRLKKDNVISVSNVDKIKKYLDSTCSKILDSGVNDGKNSLALSKSDFSELVLSKTPPFDEMCFDGFIEVFDKLKHILSL